MTPIVLQLSGISKSYGGVRAVSAVDFDLLAGEVHAVMGENGAGKSTVIKVITGATRPDDGTIRIDGQIVTDLTPAESRARGIAVIYQHPQLFPDLTVAENMAYGDEPPGALRWIDWGKRRRRAAELLAAVGAEIDPDTEVRDLSMPRQQLVEIARAVGRKAKVLILDEPTASLGDREVEHLFTLLRKLKADGVGIVYVSHRLQEIAAIADRVTVLRDGKLVATRAMATVDRPELIRLMVGRNLDAEFPKVHVVAGEPVLEVKNLVCVDGGVRNVSFTVRAGEIVGLGGLIGAGRTEIARTLFGLTPADSGSVVVNGKSIALDTPRDAVNAGLAYVPEDRRRHGIVPEMSVAANTAMAVPGKISTGGWIDRGRESALANSFVERLSIKTRSIDTETGFLSGGNAQKVAVARWLATDPKVLILDEPTQGVDVGAKAEIHRLIGDLAKRGLAILMISSDLPELLGISDRVLVVRGGKISGELSRAEATPERVMELAVSPSPGTPGEGRGEGDFERRTAIEKPNHPHPGPLRRSRLIPSLLQEYRERGPDLAKFGREIAVAGAYVLLLLALAAIAPAFFKSSFFGTLLFGAPLLVMGVGMTVVIIGKQIDISIGSIFAVCIVAAAAAGNAGASVTVVAAVSVAVGLLLGSVNGSLVSLLGLPSIVVTLATMTMLRGGLLWFTQGDSQAVSFQWFNRGQTAGQWIIVGIAAMVTIAGAVLCRWWAAARAVYAVGSDREAARLAGINPAWVGFASFALLGALTGLAAVLTAAQSAVVDPKFGKGTELAVIAAVVVGGTAVGGGRGRIAGTLIGTALLATIPDALVYFRKLNPEWALAVQGLIILAAVAAERRRRGGAA
jgi:ABC-type sugar transport system ATPase subunit/ribose/xylose/arabinose/galactoside ABC-type transport system permease subunit